MNAKMIGNVKQEGIASTFEASPSIEAVLAALAINRRRWVSRKELAAHFGTSVQVIDKLRQRRIIPHVRLPGTRRIIFSITACEAALKNFEIKSISQ